MRQLVRREVRARVDGDGGAFAGQQGEQLVADAGVGVEAVGKDAEVADDGAGQGQTAAP